MIVSWFRNCDFTVENDSFMEKRKILRRKFDSKMKFAIKDGSFTNNSFEFST